MTTIIGEVQSVSVKETSKPGLFQVGIRVDNKWHNSLTKFPQKPVQGDIITMEVENTEFNGKVSSSVKFGTLKVSKGTLGQAVSKVSQMPQKALAGISGGGQDLRDTLDRILCTQQAHETLLTEIKGLLLDVRDLTPDNQDVSEKKSATKSATPPAKQRVVEVNDPFAEVLDDELPPW
jgi:hypothetical protein